MFKNRIPVIRHKCGDSTSRTRKADGENPPPALLQSLKIPSILYQKLQYKDGRQNIHSYGQFPVFARQQVNQHITDHSQYDTVRNAVSQRHKQDADESRDSFGIIGEVYFQHSPHHHHSHQNQYRSRSGSGYRW